MIYKILLDGNTFNNAKRMEEQRKEGNPTLPWLGWVCSQSRGGGAEPRWHSWALGQDLTWAAASVPFAALCPLHISSKSEN